MSKSDLELLRDSVENGASGPEYMEALGRIVARLEANDKPVAEITAKTSGEYWRNLKLSWLGNSNLLDKGTKLYLRPVDKQVAEWLDNFTKDRCDCFFDRRVLAEWVNQLVKGLPYKPGPGAEDDKEPENDWIEALASQCSHLYFGTKVLDYRKFAMLLLSWKMNKHKRAAETVCTSPPEEQPFVERTDIPIPREVDLMVKWESSETARKGKVCKRGCCFHDGLGTMTLPKYWRYLTNEERDAS